MTYNERGYFPLDYVRHIMGHTQNPAFQGPSIDLMNPMVQRRVAQSSASRAFALYNELKEQYVTLFNRNLPTRRDGTAGEVVIVVFMGDPHIRRQLGQLYKLMRSWEGKEFIELIDQIDQFARTI